MAHRYILLAVVMVKGSKHVTLYVDKAGYYRVKCLSICFSLCTLLKIQCFILDRVPIYF